jgi:predicted pyridoxine 5'-phosphate oxidase superfamily flavin-nucleotide-binding protein
MQTFKTIPKEMKSSMMGLIPTCVSTANDQGEPNVTFISQVWYIDDEHLAVSCQFFNKTTRNVRVNPHASVMTTCPNSYAVWRVNAMYMESQTEGALYDEMSDQLAVIASMAGMEDVFRLLSADVYKVNSVELLSPGKPPIEVTS